jgi:dihydropyrimidine dehydrogenase (NAD+) subunit PreA
MADLSIEFCGIKSINPFWLASAPPTDKAYNVVRAFEAGWGGVVWKTLGEDPGRQRFVALLGALRQEPRSPRLQQYRADYRPSAGNQSARNYAGEEGLAGPRHHRFADAAVRRKLWADICRKWKTGAGIELNFGCPHGMPERGMGAAVGQVPEYVEMVTRWCKTHSKLPVIVKLTPNITDVAHRRVPPKPAVRMPSR